MPTKTATPTKRIVTTVWGVANVEWRTADNLITIIHWTATSTDGELSSSAYGSVAIPEEDSMSFVDCNQEHSIVMAQDALGPEQVAAIEASIAEQVEAQRTPESGSGGSWEMTWADVVDGTAPSNDFRWTTSDPEFLALKVGDRIKACDPAGAIAVGATCMEKREDGVSIWDMPTTLSGTNVPFRVVIDHV